MRKLVVFNHVSLDGYFVDATGGMSWAYRGPADTEWNAFVEQNAGSGGALVFGRITYQMMAAWWPTPAAAQTLPVVAARMNAAPKIVFSRTLASVAWEPTTLLHGDPATEVARLKLESGPGLVVLGSGRIVAQLAQAGLVDEYQFVLNPVALGAGRTLFEGLERPLALRRTALRTFGNGNALLTCEPAG